jgi:hypothetical protein
VTKEGLGAIDCVCSEIAGDIDAFGPEAGVILGRIMRNIGPLRDMASDAYRARISRVLANIHPEGDVVDYFAAKLLAQI